MKGVKFLSENNFQFRSLTEEEEVRLLQCCSPYVQDLVTFAIHTGLRLGNMLNLRWEEADIGQDGIKFLVRKTQRILELPLNNEAARVVRVRHSIRKSACVFYNPETGDRFKDLWLGLKKACRKAGLKGVTWHTFRHMFASRLTHGGADPVTVKELPGTCEHNNNDASRAYKPRGQKNRLRSDSPNRRRNLRSDSRGKSRETGKLEMR